MAAVARLAGAQNADGSWGGYDETRFVVTAEAVTALRAFGLRDAAYYRGVTWLENHAPAAVLGAAFAIPCRSAKDWTKSDAIGHKRRSRTTSDDHFH